MAENCEGRSFEGISGGRFYRFWAQVFGMGTVFYRRGLGDIHLQAEQRALDLGCGPGALSFALAERADPTARITGIDISEDQLTYARNHVDGFACRLDFMNASMGALPFEDNTFDLVMSSMAIHETPPVVRRKAITEVARVLRPDGTFLYIDWSKPRFGFWALIWLPMVCHGSNNKDNWNNVYPEICHSNGLSQVSDQYITSIVRRQVFQK